MTFQGFRYDDRKQDILYDNFEECQKQMKLYSFIPIFLMSCFFSTGEVAVRESLRPQVERAGYVSPYSVEFSYPESDLIFDILSGGRGDPVDEACIPYEEWYTQETKKHYGSWGPRARRFAPWEGLECKPAEWIRERVIAVGLRFEGYPYRHHHIPDWNPQPGIPDNRGIDCSCFTSFVYNLALGVTISSGIRQQAESKVAAKNDSGREVQIQRILKTTYQPLVQKLRTGDLLYINKGKRICHVIIWVGAIGRSPDCVPLILDSTGSGHKDCNGSFIPDGVFLRPFEEKSWYYRNLSHALRIIN
ncbi:MAG: NlpC/P60 family protein [Candidatus Wallbacteria bacterium]|nr:NlpC/P60 family protein [Candidatus Wallbacteria bacterium]